jgi:hypothetical protein
MGRDGLPHYYPIYDVVPFFDGLCLCLPEVRAGFGAAHRVASDRHYVMLLVLLCLWKLWNCELTAKSWLNFFVMKKNIAATNWLLTDLLTDWENLGVSTQKHEGEKIGC